jgi:serine/threonine protein phosphatase PrpC
MRVFGVSDTGCAREQNEDRILIDEDLGLFVVADGMGGHSHGEKAAELALKTIRRYIDSSRDAEVTWPFGYNFALSIEANRLITAIQLANWQVWRQAGQAPEYAGMGTTVAAVLVHTDRMTIGNVGDSRVYLWRTGELRQLTIDDTWLQAMSQRSGPKIATSNYPVRNFLTQAAGSKEVIDVHTSELDIRAGDLALISSDGLHGVIADQAISSILSSGDALDSLGARLLSEVKSTGAPDNVSLVLLAWDT